jgi:hypothetical protein
MKRTTCATLLYNHHRDDGFVVTAAEVVAGTLRATTGAACVLLLKSRWIGTKRRNLAEQLLYRGIIPTPP